MREPWMTRLSVSRPTWSVPKTLRASGGLAMRRKSVLSGSDGATSGAATDTTTISRPTRPPATAIGLRRANDPSSRATERSGRSATRPSAGTACTPTRLSIYSLASHGGAPAPRRPTAPTTITRSPRTAGPQPRDVLRLARPFNRSPRPAGPQPRAVLRLALRSTRPDARGEPGLAEVGRDLDQAVDEREEQLPSQH